MQSLHIGILALQGSYHDHNYSIHRIFPLVKISLTEKSCNLTIFDGLIVPGGESTVTASVVQDDLFEVKREFIGGGNVVWLVIHNDSRALMCITREPVLEWFCMQRTFNRAATSFYPANLKLFRNQRKHLGDSFNLPETTHWWICLNLDMLIDFAERSSVWKLLWLTVWIYYWNNWMHGRGVTIRGEKKWRRWFLRSVEVFILHIQDVFIRVSVVVEYGPGVKVISKIPKNGRELVVGVKQQNALGTGFYPELTCDVRFHHHLLSRILSQKPSIHMAAWV